jgi:hypothetical protein
VLTSLTAGLADVARCAQPHAGVKTAGRYKVKEPAAGDAGSGRAHRWLHSTTLLTGSATLSPETERAVADREVRRNLEPTLLDVDEELAPALRTLAHSGLEADEFILALWGSLLSAPTCIRRLFHSGLQIDPVGPHVHVWPLRGRASPRLRCIWH